MPAVTTAPYVSATLASEGTAPKRFSELSQTDDLRSPGLMRSGE